MTAVLQPHNISLPPYWPQRFQGSAESYQVYSRRLHESLKPAEIKFHPNRVDYEHRQQRRLRHENLRKTVPPNWPTHLKGPLVWKGEDYQTDHDFTFRLSDAEQNEIASALRAVNNNRISLDSINTETFVLPTLQHRLRTACERVYNGNGFIVLRGFDVDKHSTEDCLKVFLGVSSYVATQRAPQDQHGNILKNLVDYGRVDSEVDLPIHTDMTADVVATMTLKCSDVGGEGTVASSWTVYNELAATRPDLIHILADPNWPFDTYGRSPAYYNRPLLYHHDGKVLMNFSRRVLTGHPISGRTSGIPGLTEAQAEALDAVHFIARKHMLKFATQKGDIRFINNFAVLHGREAYKDLSPTGKAADGATDMLSRRHLLRLWLHNNEMAWSLPPQLQLVWARGFDDPDRLRVWDEAERLLNRNGGSGGSNTNNPTQAYPCD